MVLDVTGSRAITGIVAMAESLPVLIVGVWAGVLVDRFDRRKVMVLSDLVRAAIVVLIPLAYAYGLASPALLFAVTFAMAVGSSFFGPARDAMIPSLVERAHLLATNALIQSSWMMALLLGPAVAVALVSLANLHYTRLFYFDSATYLLSALCVFLIARTADTQQTPSGGSMLREVKRGLELAWRDRRMDWLLLITALDKKRMIF